MSWEKGDTGTAEVNKDTEKVKGDREHWSYKVVMNIDGINKKRNTDGMHGCKRDLLLEIG